MEKALLLKICGFYYILFAIFHILFWKLFNWKEDLKGNRIGNRAIIQILNLRIIYVFLLMAFIYLFYTNDLINTQLGFVLQVGFLVFWVGRTVEQFIFLKIKSRMVTILNILFFLGIILHLLPLL